MPISTANVCIRCGKPRVEVKTWKEPTKGGVITHTTYTCPDSECQKIIDQQFAAQKQKRDLIEKAKQERTLASKNNQQKKLKT